MMNKPSAILLAVTLLGGCGRDSVPKALDGAEKMLVGVDEALTLSKEGVDEATDQRIERCSEGEFADRKECMGILGKPVAPAYEKAAEAYDAAVEAIAAMRAAYAELEPIFDEAAKELD